MGKDKRLQINGLINGGEGRSSERLAQNPTPLIYRFIEHGREYYAYRGQAVYPFPVDEAANRLDDMFHCVIHDYVLNRKLHNSDIAPQRYRRQVLDVGCGTGLWSYDFAKAYPDTDVVGIDLMVNQPAHPDTIPNCDFRTPVDFNQPTWPFRENSFDFVRASRLCGCVPDWLALYSNMFRYLKPGMGYVEHIEIDWTPRYVDDDINTLLPQAAPLLQWWQYMQTASSRLGKPIAYQENTRSLLSRTGFTDINHKTVRIPLQPTPGDWRDFELERGFKDTMCVEDDNRQPSQSFESLSMSLFTRHLGLDPGYVRTMCHAVTAICDSRQLPLYFNIHIWTARKPMS